MEESSTESKEQMQSPWRLNVWSSEKLKKAQVKTQQEGGPPSASHGEDVAGGEGRSQPYQHLDFLASNSMRKQILFFKSPSLGAFVKQTNK